MASPATGGLRPRFGLGASLRCGVSALAICMLGISPAYAQDSGTEQPELEPTAGQTQGSDEADAPETSISASTEPQEPSAEGEAIVVTGFRQSLLNSQNIKRNADTVVDAITAQDIGALPDRSVTEALQRVPGVAINRFAGSNDPDHFSAEGSGVVVRGLSFVRSEFNGRDTFSTGVYGQAINFADVPAELLGSVEVYKNQTAEMIEGGLAGTVNMNLRLPFDNKGFHLGYDIEGSYADHADKWSPVGSILASHTWDTGIGRIGILGALAYSKLLSRSDGIQITNFQLRNGTYSDTNAAGAGTGICRAPLPSSTDATGFPPIIPQTGNGSPCYGAATGSADGLADFLPSVFAPLGGQFRTQDYNRVRKGYAAAFQWESIDRRALVTAQFLRSVATQKWGEHTFESAPDLSEYNTFPLGCHQNGNGPGGRPRAECRIDASGNFFFSGNDNGQNYAPFAGQTFPNYQYDEDGVFESGYITLPGTGWRTASSGTATTQVPTGGIQQSLSRRQVDDRNVVQDHGLNVKFKPTDRWAINLDAQYVKAKHDNLDFSVFGSNFADQELDITGELPVVIPHKPATLSATWAAPNPAMAAQDDLQYFTDPQWTFWRAAMDHIEHSRGKEWAFRGDVSYDFQEDVPFLKRVKFGARYADRDQDIKYTTYNWGSLSEVWGGSSPVFFNEAISDGHLAFYDFPDFFRGDTPGPIGGYYYNGDLIDDYRGSAELFKQIADIWRQRGATPSWVPLDERGNAVNGPFSAGELQDVSELTKAGYAMLNFGTENASGDVRVDGNVGLRYVSTKVESGGFFALPTQQELGITAPFLTDPTIIDPDTGLPVPGRCEPQIPPPPAPPIPVTPGGVCLLGAAGYAALQAFATGETVENNARTKSHHWLPSLNVKVGVGRDLIFRFAASRAITRPSLENIRNFIDVGSDTSNGFRLTASAGNPFLKPARADQFDLAAEWYFGHNDVGSLTLTGFYKRIKGFFFQQVTEREITSNGVTESIFVRGPQNFDGIGKVKGIELAYQQTYDFLPGFLSGLGASASYTYIKSKGLPQVNTFRSETSPLGVQGNLPLEQLSKHNVNFALFYEKGPVSLRAAYNWRSKFLLTSADVIFPFFPVYNDSTGQLDASAFFTVNEHMKFGIQAVNLTNEVTKTLQQFSPGLLGPRSYFMNDRRYSFILRGTFSSPRRAVAPPPAPALPPPPPATQTCADGSVIDAAGVCPAPPAPPPPPPPPPPAPERG